VVVFLTSEDDCKGGNLLDPCVFTLRDANSAPCLDADSIEYSSLGLVMSALIKGPKFPNSPEGGTAWKVT
jgi:hypothetical protein